MKLLLFSLFPLSVIFLLLNFTDYNINEVPGTPVIQEKFDPSLCRLNSLALLNEYVDSVVTAKKISRGSLEYAEEATNIVSKRFYHKYASQNFQENWIAAVSQKITGLYLSSKIKPDDILTRPYGYCGQQNTVLNDLLELNGISCRVIYFPRHFALQAYLNGKWCFFDADGEPNVTLAQCSSEKWLMNPDSLAIAYKRDLMWVTTTFGKPVQYRIERLNEIRGPKAQFFQDITTVLSRIACLFPLFLYVYLVRKQKKEKQIVYFYKKQAA